jgi:hypothetical protein
VAAAACGDEKIRVVWMIGYEEIASGTIWEGDNKTKTKQDGERCVFFLFVFRGLLNGRRDLTYLNTSKSGYGRTAGLPTLGINPSEPPGKLSGPQPGLGVHLLGCLSPLSSFRRRRGQERELASGCDIHANAIRS